MLDRMMDVATLRVGGLNLQRKQFGVSHAGWLDSSHDVLALE